MRTLVWGIVPLLTAHFVHAAAPGAAPSPGMTQALPELKLAGFGSIDEKLKYLRKSETSWRDISENGATLVVWSARHEPGPLHCDQWVQAFEKEFALGLNPAKQRNPAKPERRATSRTASSATIDIPAGARELDLSEWGKPLENWESEAIEAIVKCDEFPCDVKLNSSEASTLKSKPPAERHSAYLDLIQKRVSRYLADQTPREFEYAGDPVDPFSYWLNQGAAQSLGEAQAPHLRARILDFAKGKMRKIRQVIDERVVESPAWSSGTGGPQPGTGAIPPRFYFARSVYNAHYFDSWGELFRLDCSPTTGVRVLQSLFIELDQLKEGDLLSVLGRPRMKQTVREKGLAALDDRWQSVLKQFRSGR